MAKSGRPRGRPPGKSATITRSLVEPDLPPEDPEEIQRMKKELEELRGIEAEKSFEKESAAKLKSPEPSPKPLAASPVPVPPPVSAPAPQTPARAEVAETPPMKKTEAVRRALEAGIDKPKEASAWILQHLGVDVPPAIFSSYKTSEKKKLQEITSSSAAPRVTVSATPRATAPQTKAPLRSPLPSSNGSVFSGVELAEKIKELLTKYEPDDIIRMTQILAD